MTAAGRGRAESLAPGLAIGEYSRQRFRLRGDLQTGDRLKPGQIVTTVSQ
jgi:hypothetical protein